MFFKTLHSPKLLDPPKWHHSLYLHTNCLVNHNYPTVQVKKKQWAICFTPEQLNTDQMTKQKGAPEGLTAISDS